MKSATVADLRNHFASVSRWIYEGESVAIRKRGRAFAILSPAQKRKPAPPWPAFEERLRRSFPDGPAKGAGAKALIDAMRGDY